MLNGTKDLVEWFVSSRIIQNGHILFVYWIWIVKPLFLIKKFTINFDIGMVIIFFVVVQGER